MTKDELKQQIKDLKEEKEELATHNRLLQKSIDRYMPEEHKAKITAVQEDDGTWTEFQPGISLDNIFMFQEAAASVALSLDEECQTVEIEREEQ